MAIVADFNVYDKGDKDGFSRVHIEMFYNISSLHKCIYTLSYLSNKVMKVIVYAMIYIFASKREKLEICRTSDDECISMNHYTMSHISPLVTLNITKIKINKGTRLIEKTKSQ